MGDEKIILQRILSPTRKVTVKKFRNHILVDIREFYEKEDSLLPGRKGISLTTEQFQRLVEIAPAVLEAAQTGLGPRNSRLLTKSELFSELRQEVALDPKAAVVGENPPVSVNKPSANVAANANVGAVPAPIKEEFDAIKEEFESTKSEVEPTKDEVEPTTGDYEPIKAAMVSHEPDPGKDDVDPVDAVAQLRPKRRRASEKEVSETL